MGAARHSDAENHLVAILLPGITTVLERGAEGEVSLGATGPELLSIRERESQTEPHSRLNIELQACIEIQFRAGGCHRWISDVDRSAYSVIADRRRTICPTSLTKKSERAAVYEHRNESETAGGRE